MEWFEYLIIAACVLFVGSVIFFHFYLKKKGKSLAYECSGKCQGCSGSCCGSKENCQKILKEYKETFSK